MTNAVNATLYQDLNFDFARDIAPVVGTFRSPNVLTVTQSLPAKTLVEFIAYAKANPGKINYASFGYGTAPNMSAELFKMMAGVDLVHVPYRGSYMADLIGGQVQVAFSPIALSIEQIKAGKLRALAVTGTTRSAALPDVPTVADFVPGYTAIIWHGIGAPKDTPVEIVNKLNTEINAALADSTLQARFADLGGTAIGGSPGRLWQAHRRRNREVGQGRTRRQYQAGVSQHAGAIILEDIMKLLRRQFLHLAAMAGALPALTRAASALDYPTRPVRIIVGFRRAARPTSSAA